MNWKKALPYLLLIIFAVLTIAFRRCNNESQTPSSGRRDKASTRTTDQRKGSGNSTSNLDGLAKLDRKSTNLFFTKHAKCRMKCRHITQKEIKSILLNGTINYKKSDLNDSRGSSYAVEGITEDRQHVRIIFAPKKQHLTVVTVIDLEEEYVCNCN